MTESERQFSATVLNAFKIDAPEAVEPSAFEKHVAEQLKSLSEAIFAGEWSIEHFSLTVADGRQKMEIRVI